MGGCCATTMKQNQTIPTKISNQPTNITNPVTNAQSYQAPAINVNQVSRSPAIAATTNQVTNPVQLTTNTFNDPSFGPGSIVPPKAPSLNQNTSYIINQMTRQQGAPSPGNHKFQSYVAPPSIVQPKTTPYAPPVPHNSTHPQNHRLTYQNTQNGYPDMNNYSNPKSNYLNAAGKQSLDVLHDEDYGYYAANARNVNLRVDMNS